MNLKQIEIAAKTGRNKVSEPKIVQNWFELKNQPICTQIRPKWI